jgi:dihydroorotase-like cyclic amidohydrolase
MPLNSIPPTTTVGNLNVKRTEAKEVGTNCDVGFWGGIIPGNEGDLSALLDEGVKGFKCFLIESGVDVSSPEIKWDKLTNRNSLVLLKRILSRLAML